MVQCQYIQFIGIAKAGRSGAEGYIGCIPIGDNRIAGAYVTKLSFLYRVIRIVDVKYIHSAMRSYKQLVLEWIDRFYIPTVHSVPAGILRVARITHIIAGKVSIADCIQP